jgi:hypothetical protein
MMMMNNGMKPLRCFSSLTQPQQLARYIREHYTALSPTAWDTTSSSLGDEGCWSSFLQNSKVLPSDANAESTKILRTQLTAMLSYPLSLAWLLGRKPQHMHASELNVHILGARAEAMFPDWIWEVQSKIYKSRNQKVTVDLVGPMVVDLGSRNDRTIGGNMRIRHHPGLLYHDAAHALDDADVFVAFHPGWGQPEWQPSWRPTLEKIMEKTIDKDASMYFTSFDASDMADDIAFVQEMNPNGSVWGGGENPFRSELFLPHDKHSERMITQNNFVSGWK